MLHVAVTGASSGIGEAIAREFAGAGAKLTLVARRRDLLESLAGKLKTPCRVIAQDLSDPEAACTWIPEAEAALGPIDVLVNNAGVELVALMAESDLERAERLLRLNLHSPLRIMHAVLSGMIARGRGTIVNVSSVAALAPQRGYAVYAASKAGLAAASEAVRSEVLRSGVNVVTVYPGPVHSDMAENAVAALEDTFWVKNTPWGKADVLARRVRKAVDAGRARVIYPRFYALARIAPWLARWLTDSVAPWPRGRAVAVVPAPSPVPGVS